FEKITLRRPEEVSNRSSLAIHAVVFEVEDRKYIGGSAYGGKRAIIHHPSAKDSGWPQVFGVSLSENELSGMLPTRYIQITRTDVYNLCFIHCDLDLKDMVVEGKTIWENAWIIPAFWQLLSF
uniref:Uncharacterized protein n=1 Tax=Brassica oleracea var. oleracea TaxID=109376 RepID=A0A0D3CX39_BRAOL